MPENYGELAMPWQVCSIYIPNIYLFVYILFSAVHSTLPALAGHELVAFSIMALRLAHPSRW